jgi:hypothetical protein
MFTKVVDLRYRVQFVHFLLIVLTLFFTGRIETETPFPNQTCNSLYSHLILSLLSTGWEKELPKCRDVLTRGRELAQAILRVGEPAAQLQLANSARLALASNLKLVEKGQTSLATGALLPELVDDYEATQLAVTALLNRVNELKA